MICTVTIDQDGTVSVSVDSDAIWLNGTDNTIADLLNQHINRD